MHNLNNNEVETKKCSENLIIEDVISETSYMSLTSVVRGESTSDNSGASVDLSLEKSSIVYAPEFMQNEGGEKNLALPGVELETQKSVSKNLPSEENITAEKPVSTLLTQEKSKTDIEDGHGRAFYAKSCYALIRLQYLPKIEEPKTYQTPEEFIAQIEAEHKAKKDALSELTEPDFTFFISTPSTRNNDSLVSTCNNIASTEPENTISSSNSENNSNSLPNPNNNNNSFSNSSNNISLSEPYSNNLSLTPDINNSLSFSDNTTVTHSNDNSHLDNILPPHNSINTSHSSQNTPSNNDHSPHNFNNILHSDTTNALLHSDTSHSIPHDKETLSNFSLSNCTNTTQNTKENNNTETNLDSDTKNSSQQSFTVSEIFSRHKERYENTPLEQRQDFIDFNNQCPRFKTNEIDTGKTTFTNVALSDTEIDKDQKIKQLIERHNELYEELKNIQKQLRKLSNNDYSISSKSNDVLSQINVLLNSEQESIILTEDAKFYSCIQDGHIPLPKQSPSILSNSIQSFKNHTQRETNDIGLNFFGKPLDPDNIITKIYHMATPPFRYSWWVRIKKFFGLASYKMGEQIHFEKGVKYIGYYYYYC